MSVAEKIVDSEVERATREYAANGYFVLRNIVPREPLLALRDALTREFERAMGSGALFSGGGQVSGHLNFFPGSGARFAYDALLEGGVVDLLGKLNPDVQRLPNVGGNFNLPGSHTQHYHTDSPFTRGFMIANVAAVDTAIENGATDVIPGTHRRFYKYTHFVLQRCSRGALRVPLNCGDVLVRSSNVWHRGMTNRTAAPRPMLAFTWEDGGSNVQDPFGIYGGRIRFLPNWFKPTAMGRFRERLFVRAPFIYSALRFGRSLIDSKY